MVVWFVLPKGRPKRGFSENELQCLRGIDDEGADKGRRNSSSCQRCQVPASKILGVCDPPLPLEPVIWDPELAPRKGRGASELGRLLQDRHFGPSRSSRKGSCEAASPRANDYDVV